MKRIFFAVSLVATTLLSAHTWAQSAKADTTRMPMYDTTMPKIEFGVKLGANFRTVSGTTWTSDYKPGIVGGITVGAHGKKAGVQAEVLIGTSGYVSKTLSDSLGNKLNIHTVSFFIPVLFEYKVIPALKIQLGPQYSNLVSAKSVNGFNGDPKVLFKGSEFSGVLGVEARLPAHFTVGARYILGLTVVNNKVITEDTWNNSTIQGYVGYSIQ